MTVATVALGRARGSVVAGLIGFTVLSWAYLGFLATRAGDMSSVLAMPMTPSWSLTQAALMAVMWAVMMAAMMLPSGIPMVLTYDKLDGGTSDDRGGSTPLFVTGYVVVWAVFALGATALQWMLATVAIVDGMGVVTETWFAGALLIGAGAVQFTPGKFASLGACRTPMGFLMTSWREGSVGALRMGLHHGRLCLGCCWSLMLLLFVLGVMNLAWVAVLAIFVLAEKVAPRGVLISRVGGVVLAVGGVIVVMGVRF
jgi:predicted metal-binding membrane protein